MNKRRFLRSLAALAMAPVLCRLVPESFRFPAFKPPTKFDWVVGPEDVEHLQANLIRAMLRPTPWKDFLSEGVYPSGMGDVYTKPGFLNTSA